MDDFAARFNERKAARRQEDRSFVILGETLTVRAAVSSDVGFQFQEALALNLEASNALANIANVNGGGNEEAVAFLRESQDKQRKYIALLEETIVDCLEPGTHEAWLRLRAKDAADPLSSDEIFEIAEYLLGRASEVPTSAPADSSAGRTETAKPSKAKSSSRAMTPTPSP